MTLFVLLLSKLEYGMILGITAAVPCALTIRKSDPEYKDTTIAKIWLVLSACFSFQVLGIDHMISRVLLAMNIGCLAYLKTKYRIPIIALALSTIVCPIDLRVGIPYVLILGAYMLEQERWEEHIVLNMWALILPVVLSPLLNMHWVKLRGLCLIALICYDRFDKKNSGL